MPDAVEAAAAVLSILVALFAALHPSLSTAVFSVSFVAGAGVVVLSRRFDPEVEPGGDD